MWITFCLAKVDFVEIKSVFLMTPLICQNKSFKSILNIFIGIDKCLNIKKSEVKQRQSCTNLKSLATVILMQALQITS